MRIHIFRAGEQISSSGYTKTFSEADLDSMVQSFNPSIHEPPIRVGHEDNDKVPAFGWVKEVSKEGENLYAEVEFTPEMEEMIRQGNYKKVSASFYPPESQVNPNKGSYTLKHVAMLGGVPPAVKGLEPILFSEGDDEAIMTEIEFECSDGKKQKKKTEEQPQEVEGEEEEEESTPEEFVEPTPKKKKPTSKKEKVEPTPPPEVEEEEEEEPTSKKEKVEPPEEEEPTPEVEEEEEEEETPTPEKEEVEPETPPKKKKPASNYSEPVPARVVVKVVEEEEEEEEEEGEDYAEKLRAMEIQFAELKASEERTRAELQRVIRERRYENLAGRVEHLYSEGQMTDGIFPQKELLEFVVGLDEGTLEFAEGESASDCILGILARIPAPVNFSELVTEEQAPVVEEEFEDFSEKVESYAKTHNMTFEQALRVLAVD